MPLYALGNRTPTIHPDAFVHPDAVVIGDVRIGADSSVWPSAVLRGDYGTIIVGERTSIQDGAIIHAVAEFPTVKDAEAAGYSKSTVYVPCIGAHYTDTKIKKSHDESVPEGDHSAPVIELVRNPDVLADLVASRGSAPSPVIVGFAAETGDCGHTVLDHARDKLVRKGCDLLVANEVGANLVFGEETNTVHILRRGVDATRQVGPASKDVVAATVWDVIQEVLS